MVPGMAAALGCSVVCGAMSLVAQTSSLVPWPVAWPGLTSDAALKKTAIKKNKIAEIRKSNTYRSERRWVAVNLLLVWPVGTCAPNSAVRGAGGSPATRSAVVAPLSGRLGGLRTNDGTASSSSSSSIRTNRRRFGARLLSAGSIGAGDGSAGIGLFPATLSSVVGTGRACSSSLLV